MSATYINLFAAELDQAAQREYFEKRIRPVLAVNCYQCHNSHEKPKGGLVLDHRSALLEGGDRGPAIEAGNAKASLLIKAIQHEIPELKMPKDGAKLDDDVIEDFVRWIESGAFDSRDQPPNRNELESSTSWEAVLETRKQWWSFQPIQQADPPQPKDTDASNHPIDRFIGARLEPIGLRPALPAEPRVVLRRLSYALTGLPPTVEEIDAFIGNDRFNAYDRAVDRLINSPRFGEKWARHWMDWFRYADTHGSEGDPGIPYAWRYRDFLIRALNDDVPYAQLILEHVAGDLLPNPRINHELGIKESALGIGHYRMVQHGYSPTDPLDELVRFTDNQIDVLSKSFLGLTVSCARCHNHKFDAISQTDFYALFGIMASCKPGLVTVDTSDRLDRNKDRLLALKPKIKAQLATAWLESMDTFGETLRALPVPTTKESKDEPVESHPYQGVVDAASQSSLDPLHALVKTLNANGDSAITIWETLKTEWDDSRRSREQFRKRRYPVRWDLSGEDYHEWFIYGTGLPDVSSQPGEFHVLAENDRLISAIYPAGVYTHTLSSKHNGVLNSPKFTADTDEVWIRALGERNPRFRYVVENYPRGSGPVYHNTRVNADIPTWRKIDIKYWNGDTIHLELATAGDIPIEARADDFRSWFGVMDVVCVRDDQERPKDEPADFVSPLFESSGQAPTQPEAIINRYVTSVKACVEAWRDGTLTNDQANYLGYFVRMGLLPNSVAALPSLQGPIDDYRRLEAQIPVPTRAPGLWESVAFDQPLFVRGNHKNPGERVPRRFLEAFAKQRYQTAQSGRLELAEELLQPDNPLVARVIVNRIWHHLFGRGIVASTDNFGRLGEKPSHPELLDYLANRFVDQDWSIKEMVRFIVRSQIFRSSSGSSLSAERIDPDNRKLSHFPINRMEAEAIRDTMFSLSGRLESKMFGPSVDGTEPRRSVYVSVRRNRLDPLLTAFDSPEPLTTRGRRNVTNVPAQSLTLLNDPLVIDLASSWAIRILSDPQLQNTDDRTIRMYEQAYGRTPTPNELDGAREYLAKLQDIDRILRERQIKLERDLETAKSQLAAIIDPVRQSILSRRESGDDPGGLTFAPVALWTFDENLNDSIGTAHGTARGPVRVENGGLILDGESYVETALLNRTLTEKTLEVWVKLKDLNQRGGGAMTVQTPDGATFDSIVYGEQNARHWMAGSNFFARTESFDGPPEKDAILSPLHFAIVYDSAGRIAGYRNGKIYGEPYESSGPVTFEAGESMVVFGCRHTPPGGGKMLNGQITEARLYDRALTPVEIAASANRATDFVGDEEIVANLTIEQKREKVRLEQLIEQRQEELHSTHDNISDLSESESVWSDFAQSIFNSKEFVYIY